MAEDRVDGVDDGRVRAEVFAFRFAEAVALLGENGRIGQAEPVDGLFHVADEEEVLPLPADGVEEQVLDAADVLILIHHDLAKARGDLAGDRSGRSVRVHEEAERKVLEVAEVGAGRGGACSGQTRGQA